MTPALLAGLAVLVLVGLPGASSLRLQQALPRGASGAAGPGAGPDRRRRPATRAVGVRPLAAVAALLTGTALDGAVLGLVLALVAVAAVSAHLRRRAAAAAVRERVSAGEACAVLAAELRAGRAPAAALESAAETARGGTRSRLHAAAAAARLGGDVAASLRTGPATAVPAATALAACWQVCSGTGAGLAAAVERLEEGLRSEAAAQRAVQAELAGPRATAGLLAVLPLAGIGLAAGLGARPLHVLLHTAVGVVCLLLGLALDLLGLAWTRRIAARAGG